MKKVLKNEEMLAMLHQLQPLLAHKDLCGYVAARNARILSECLIEYDQVRKDLIDRFGTETTDANTGMPSLAIKIGTPEFKSFCDALEPFNKIEHEVDLMMMKYEDTIGVLTGEEILAVDWMLEE